MNPSSSITSSGDLHLLQQRADELLYPAVVLHSGRTFGLEWRSGTVEDPEILVGGWLKAVPATKKTKKTKPHKLAFYTLDDRHACLRRNKNEDDRGSAVIRYADISAVEPVTVPEMGLTVVELTHESASNKSPFPPVVRLKPIGDDDETLARWVAALRFRCASRESYLAVLLEQHRSALKVALWLQSVYRMEKAIGKAERMRERRQGLMATVGYWWNGSYDDSDDSDDGEDSVDGDYEDDGDRGGNVVVSIFSAIMSDLYSNTLGANDPESPDDTTPKLMPSASRTKARSSLTRLIQRANLPERSSLVRRSSPTGNAAPLKRKNTIASSFRGAEVTNAHASNLSSARALERKGTAVESLKNVYTLPPLRFNEVEDEMWENERWVIKRGWSRSNLLPTDRKGFTDRIGHGKYSSLASYPTPAAWSVTSDFRVDNSAVGVGRCDKDGWIYQRDFGPLDSDLARGTTKPQGGTSCFVRRRRWFRRRVRDFLPRAGPTPVIVEGWLGKRELKNGRWINRYYVLARGLNVGGVTRGVSLIHFRFRCKDFEEYRYNADLSGWADMNASKLKMIRILRLDGCKVADVSSKSKPGWFAVKLAEESAPRYFNAATQEARLRWMSCIKSAVEDQFAQFTLSRTLKLPLHGAVAKVDRYENPMVDRLVPMPVDRAFELLFHNDKVVKRILEYGGHATDVELHPWTLAKSPNSRREITYTDVGRPRERIPASDALLKMKLVFAKPGEGYHIDTSLQLFKVQYGGIYQQEVRVLLTRWDPDPNRTRILVSQQTNVRSTDEELKLFLSSYCKQQMLAFYTEEWLPCVKEIIKEKMERESAKDIKSLVSPSGLRYSVSTKDTSMKNKLLSMFGGVVAQD